MRFATAAHHEDLSASVLARPHQAPLTRQGVDDSLASLRILGEAMLEAPQPEVGATNHGPGMSLVACEFGGLDQHGEQVSDPRCVCDLIDASPEKLRNGMLRLPRHRLGIDCGPR